MESSDVRIETRRIGDRQKKRGEETVAQGAGLVAQHERCVVKGSTPFCCPSSIFYGWVIVAIVMPCKVMKAFGQNNIIVYIVPHLLEEFDCDGRRVPRCRESAFNSDPKAFGQGLDALRSEKRDVCAKCRLKAPPAVRRALASAQL